MDEKQPSSIADISPEDWAATPESVKRLVGNLMGQIERLAELVGRVETLERQQEALKAENQLLKEQVKQDSKNSSKPPSQDMAKGFKAKPKEISKRKPGAQPGHEGHERRLYPIEQCQSVENHYPERCIECGARLTGEDAQAYRIQIVEIPPIKPQVSEHRFHCRQCEQCGAMTRTWDDAIINGSGYGERVAAHVAVLSGQYRQSHQMVQALLHDLFGVEISTGSINRLRQESSQAVVDAVQVAYDYVQTQGNVNMDETSFAQGNGDGNNPNRRKGWLWVMVTPLVSYFAVRLSRSKRLPESLRHSVCRHCQQRPLQCIQRGAVGATPDLLGASQTRLYAHC
jgi:transposase